MQKYVAKNVALNFKNLVIGGDLKTIDPLKRNEEQFFKYYDQMFMKNTYIQDCLKNELLRIPVDFFQESRYDDFAEDHSDFLEQEHQKQK
ncbi:unnamed protein product [Paramecium octaurelia]|uniref:Uncharacterized protein n=1 Tax=Paramecium octaurelia TaxID=43137 RepID=A0A8S1VST7_PAROT|nr:unnamed protein product [Paramecium octaurelia]